LNRARVTWSQDVVETIKAGYIALAIDSKAYLHRGDAEAKFFESMGGAPGGNNWVAVSPNGGAFLSNNEHYYVGATVYQGLEKWKELPEEERKPGLALQSFGDVDVDPSFEKCYAPPEGGLKLKVYFRPLKRDDQGKVAHEIESTDFGNGPINNLMPPNYDHFWISQEEWQAVVPEGAKAGDTFAFPDGLLRRLARLTMVDAARCTTWASPRDQISGEATLKVVAASSECVSLYLSGSAQVPAGAFELGGRLEFDPTTKAFRRFDLVAFCETGWRGFKPNEDQPQPLGIGYELLSGEGPMDRVPPHHFTADWRGDPRGYVDDYFRSE